MSTPDSTPTPGRWEEARRLIEAAAQMIPETCPGRARAFMALGCLLGGDVVLAQATKAAAAEKHLLAAIIAAQTADLYWGQPLAKALDAALSATRSLIANPQGGGDEPCPVCDSPGCRPKEGVCRDALSACECPEILARSPDPATPPEGEPVILASPQTDLDRKIAALLAEADARTGPWPLANGGELIRDLASCLRIVLQEQEDSETAWASQKDRADKAETDRDALARALVAEREEVRRLREALSQIANLYPPDGMCAQKAGECYGINDGKSRAILLQAALNVARGALGEGGANGQ